MKKYLPRIADKLLKQKLEYMGGVLIEGCKWCGKPRLLDEWQMYPVVWDAIRTDVDKTGLKGQYILTGSARPTENLVMHTGTGRITKLLMRPMSLYESQKCH